MRLAMTLAVVSPGGGVKHWLFMTSYLRTPVKNKVLSSVVPCVCDLILILSGASHLVTAVHKFDFGFVIN